VRVGVSGGEGAGDEEDGERKTGGDDVMAYEQDFAIFYVYIPIFLLTFSSVLLAESNLNHH
jgi:hypothetical protein